MDATSFFKKQLSRCPERSINSRHSDLFLILFAEHYCNEKLRDLKKAMLEDEVES
jgi:hypothetical protein